jgi:uncharacterized protein YjiS (DUF1127 family)
MTFRVAVCHFRHTSSSFHAFTAWLAEVFGAYPQHADRPRVAPQQTRGRSATTTPRWTRLMDWIRPMNATFAKNQMAHLVPAGQSYSGTDEGAADAMGSPSRGLARRIADAIAHLVALPRRRAVLDELSTLTDRELADIGVSRSDLKRVFDPAFTQGRLRGRPEVGYVDFKL